MYPHMITLYYFSLHTFHDGKCSHSISVIFNIISFGTVYFFSQAYNFTCGKNVWGVIIGNIYTRPTSVDEGEFILLTGTLTAYHTELHFVSADITFLLLLFLYIHTFMVYS